MAGDAYSLAKCDDSTRMVSDASLVAKCNHTYQFIFVPSLIEDESAYSRFNP